MITIFARCKFMPKPPALVERIKIYFYDSGF
jgi:hypothetical protein